MIQNQVVRLIRHHSNMIHIENGNLFDCQAEAYVNTVNCVGVMGKGIALEFKRRYPQMCERYRHYCQDFSFEGGDTLVYDRGEEFSSPRFIINLATKEHWRNPSKLEWIDYGCLSLRRDICFHNIKSIAIPALGCSNGGLSWKDVKPIIERHLKDLDCEIYLFEPNGM